MFGKKILDYGLGLQEEPDEWEGKEEPKRNSQNGDGKSKVRISSEITGSVREHFFQLVNPSIAASLSRDELIDKVTQAVAEIVDREKIPLNWKEQGSIARDLLNDMIGVGPVEELLRDDEVTDILVNGPEKIFVERQGRLELTELSFRDEDHLMSVARRIAVSAGRRVDESNPMVDARLIDGSRVNIILPPLSVYGTIISIRKFPAEQICLMDLVEKDSLSSQMAEFMEIAAASRLNILISGGTGAGKTTFLNALSGKIGESERVVTIEDAAEINLQKPHVISLETRQKNVEGSGEISQRDLLRNALRMRPDRIIIGEVRGAEVHEMLQAMNTGHDGSMSTIHANSARDALVRIEDLLLSYQTNFNADAVKRQIASSLDLVIHLNRSYTGHRYVQSITEVIGVEGETIVTQDLFHFEEHKSSVPDVFEGEFQHLKIRPHCEKKIQRCKLGDVLRRVLGW